MAENNVETVFPDRILKKLPDGFPETVSSMKDDELKQVVFECEGNLYSIEKDKDADVKLNSAKEQVKEHSLPYREAKACQNAKIRYVMWLLEGRGVSLDNKEI
jgi:hypothetical protein